jgi:hypothetical protein
MPKKYWAMRPI